MPSRIGYWLAFSGAAAGLAWLSWPGAPTDPATLINRVDVVAIVVMLAVLPWAAGRLFGPAGTSRVARTMRIAGYAAVFALVLVKAHVERSEFAAPAGRPGLAGLWAGEMVLLVVVAAYITGLLAVTTRRTPVRPGALAIGTGAGITAGLAMYALPPLAHPPQVANAWLTGAYGAARVLVVPLVAGAGIAAGLLAARRTSGRGSQLPLADARARQGVAAGLCAGAAAALVVSVLGISTIALLPQEAARLQWALPPAHATPGSLYAFEVSLSDSAAGHLLILIIAPLLFAGLGAWGGLYGAGPPGRRPGGGGGGGGRWPAPAPPPPGGVRRRGDVALPALYPGVPLPGLAVGDGLPQPSEADRPAPGRPERMPVSTAAGWISGSVSPATLPRPPVGKTRQPSSHFDSIAQASGRPADNV